MLTRIISGAVGVALMIVVFIFHDTIFLPIAVAVMIAVMLYELLRVVKLNTNIPILCAVEGSGISMPFIYARFHYLPHGMDGGDSITKLSARPSQLAFVITLAAAFIIFLTWLSKHKEIRYEQVFFTLAVMVFVPQAMSTMVRIDRYSIHHGLILLILGLCGAWIADTGAYFTGVALGKHKLCPEISPKKTIEGFVGGIVITGLVFVGVSLLYNKKIAEVPVPMEPYEYALMGLAGCLCAVIGTIGDLSASMVKRQTGIKDYGKIMPGHGGLMDRFDSVLFVLPTFYAFVTLTGVFR